MLLAGRVRIRDVHVTRVQTCALPISRREALLYAGTSGSSDGSRPSSSSSFNGKPAGVTIRARSEERRVGKECRARGRGGAQTNTKALRTKPDARPHKSRPRSNTHQQW